MSVDLSEKHKYYNNNLFGKWARLYDYEKYVFSPLRKKAAKILDLPAPQKVLDVATGTGAQAYELAKLGYEVVGIDLSPAMLAQAQKKCSPELRLTFQLADATSLPFKDNEFDASTISFGLHDMPHDIELAVLKEIKRVTKQGGRTLIVDYNEPKKHWAAKLAYPLISLYETKYWQAFLARGLKQLLQEAGLTIDKETTMWGLVQLALLSNTKI